MSINTYNTRKISEIEKCFKRYTTPKLDEYEEIIINKYIQARSKILDACGGGGRVAVPIAKAGHRVVSVDYDEKFIRTAKKRWHQIENLQFVRSDIRKFCVPNDLMHV